MEKDRGRGAQSDVLGESRIKRGRTFVPRGRLPRRALRRRIKECKGPPACSVPELRVLAPEEEKRCGGVGAGGAARIPTRRELGMPTGINTLG